MWGFRVKFSSITTPKNTVSFEPSIEKARSYFCLGWKIIKLDFFQLKESLFARHQSDNFVISRLKVVDRVFISLWEKKIFVSSAKSINSKTFDILHKSLMYIRNKRAQNWPLRYAAPNLLTRRAETIKLHVLLPITQITTKPIECKTPDSVVF